MAGENLFSSGDASALRNGTRLPFVVAMTCLNGFFDAEPDVQSIMNQGLTRQLFTPGMSIGEAARRAKMAITDPDVRHSWILFGGPSMKLK